MAADDHRNDMLSVFIRRQEDYNKSQTEMLQQIHRGLYGDEKNKVKGLMDRVDAAEIKIEKHDTVHKRIGFGMAGFLFAVELGWHGLKEYLSFKK